MSLTTPHYSKGSTRRVLTQASTMRFCFLNSWSQEPETTSCRVSATASHMTRHPKFWVLKSLSRKDNQRWKAQEPAEKCRNILVLPRHGPMVVMGLPGHLFFPSFIDSLWFCLV